MIKQPSSSERGLRSLVKFYSFTLQRNPMTVWILGMMRIMQAVGRTVPSRFKKMDDLPEEEGNPASELAYWLAVLLGRMKRKREVHLRIPSW